MNTPTPSGSAEPGRLGIVVMPGVGRAQGGGSGGFRPGCKPGPKSTSGTAPRIRKKRAKAAAVVVAAAASAVERQGEHGVQQHGEAAGTSGVAAVGRMPSQRMATKTAAQQAAAATAAEPQAAQRGKLTAFFKP